MQFLFCLLFSPAEDLDGSDWAGDLILSNKAVFVLIVSRNQQKIVCSSFVCKERVAQGWCTSILIPLKNQKFVIHKCVAATCLYTIFYLYCGPQWWCHLMCVVRLVEMYEQLIKDERIVASLDHQQKALGHCLPLSAYLFKPVQRMLKYHLLLQVSI